MDAQGCAADVAMTRVRWELKKPDAARGQLGDGCFRAAASAADAEGTFRVSALHEGLRAEATVVVVAPDLSDITARRATTPSPEGTLTPNQASARGMEDAGVKTAAVKRRDPTTLWVAIGAVGLILLAAGLFVVMRVRSKAAAAQAKHAARLTPAPRDPVARPPSSDPSGRAFTPVESPAAQPAKAATPAPVEKAPAGEQMICPSCRRGYPPGAERCEGDGSPLVPYSEFVRRAKEAETTSTACPGCGAKVAGGSVFCGTCGRKLTS